MKLRTRTNQPVEGDEIENLKITGELQSFENIVDKDGHKRFQEFNGVGIEQEVIEILYNKASLIGTHLLIVLALSVSNGTTIVSDSVLTSFTIPQWVLDKIVPIQATIVTNNTQLMLRASDWSYQDADVVLEKKTDKITITYVGANLTLTADRIGRVQIDLLIDNE